MNKRSPLNFTIVLITFFLYNSLSFTQTYGPELIPLGNFGTIDSQGKNGDDVSISSRLYGEILSTHPDVGVYYQPATRVFHNGNLINIAINPAVTIGYPLVNKTDYRWGFTEPWTSDSYRFPKLDDSDSEVNVPNAPNNGNYLVGTSTNGMYNLPSLNAASWYQIYDKYETNTLNPTNYFLITNADNDPKKIFYKEKIDVTAGQVYRMSADLSRLNRTGDSPDVAFIISSNETDLKTVAPVYITSDIPDTKGSWVNHYFDYVVPCGVSSIYLAFRNQKAGGNGNDIALDNLSMKAIIPRIDAEIIQNEDDCSATLRLDGSIPGVLNEARYIYQWQKKDGTNFNSISSATDRQYITSTAGNYRVAIYTTETDSCPMYSNSIQLIPDESNCLTVEKPEAKPDYFATLADIALEGNVLVNDIEAPGGDPDSLYVLSYEINEVIYPAGTTNIIPNVGVFTLNKNGNFTFKSVVNYQGMVPTITYYMTEPGFGKDTTTLDISIINYILVIDDYCVACPITVKIISNDTTFTTGTISLYRDTIFKATGSYSDGSMIFTFQEDTSGLLFYSLKQYNTEITQFNFYVSPARATWTPNTVVNSQQWTDAYNWSSETGGGFPVWCTDVVIPADAPFYPIIEKAFDQDDNEYDFDQCRDIYFESGSTIGRVNYLLYRKAFVQHKPNIDEWSMLTAPLKYMYSADYHADISWGEGAAIDPRIYMRYFDVEYMNGKSNPDDSIGVSIGAFSKPFANLKEPLNLGQGFVLNIGTSEQNFFNGTFDFPRRDTNGNDITYMYHYTDNGEWITDDSAGSQYAPFNLDRGDLPPNDEEWMEARNSDRSNFNPRGTNHRYRFIFEKTGQLKGSAPVELPVTSVGTTNIIGNPFMSHLNFDSLYLDNSTKIQRYYRTFDGSNFHSYMNTDEVISKEDYVWAGLDGVGTGGESVQRGNLIAPMQAFFVESIAGNTITVNPDKALTVPVVLPPTEEEGGADTRSAKSVSPNVLRIHLKMGEKENIAILGVLPKASDNYKASEDIEKLFADEESILQIANSRYYPVDIYTVSDHKAIEINAVSDKGDEKIIPVGIKTKQTGKGTISIQGVDRFTAYQQIFFIDAKNNEKYNLKEVNGLSFEIAEDEDIVGRFYLEMKNEPETGIPTNTDENKNLMIFSSNRYITVSSPINEINNIDIYDVSGRLIYKKENLNSLYEQFSPGMISGIYIIKVKTKKHTYEDKIKF